MPLTWVYSWVMGRLPVLIALAGLLAGLWYYGHTRYNAGEAAVEARWAVQLQADATAARKAQDAADATLKRQKQATLDAARLFTEKQNENALLADRNRALADRLRSALARRADPVPAAPADPGGTEPEGAGVDAVTVAIALSGFARGCAESRDGLRDQVNALIDGWPR
jgi:hypothetical protein